MRRPNGRIAIQRRAAAANYAVAAAVAAEAADIHPANNQYSSRAASNPYNAHKQNGGVGLPRTGLEGIRSGRITKTARGGSIGAAGSMRFGSLMTALGELEAEEGSFEPQGYANRSLGTSTVAGLGTESVRPALFGNGGTGFVNRWHEPLGAVSPRILTLSSDLFQLGSSSFGAAGWSAAAPSSCHAMHDAGAPLQPHFPLFKAS